MLGSKFARIPRPFIRQSSVPNAINQNLRPKIANFAYQHSMSNASVEGAVNHTLYYMPETVPYEMCVCLYF